MSTSNDRQPVTRHDLRTQLTIIAGFTKTLLNHNDRLDAARRLEMLEAMDDAATKLGELIDQLPKSTPA